MCKTKFCIINNKYLCIIYIGKLCINAGLQLKVYKLKISTLTKYISKKLTEDDEIGNIEFNIIADDINKAEITVFQVREKFRKQHIGKTLFSKGKNILLHYYNVKKLNVSPISFPYPNESYTPTKDLYSIYKKLGFQFKDNYSNPNISGKEMYMHLK